MRIGELVKTPDGRIGRVESVDENGRTGVTDHGHVSYWALSVLTIATVADVFEYAGFPVPDGAKLVCQFCVERHEPTRASIYPRQWHYRVGDKAFSFGDKGWKRNRPIKSEVSTIALLTLWGLDLSRLPASDAWDALPEAVRAAVEGVKGDNDD